MILTCPDCATRYSTNPDAIGPNGRTVRCSNCEATWFVAAEPDIMELREQEAGLDGPIIREVPREVSGDIPEKTFGKQPEDIPPDDTSDEDTLSATPAGALGAHVTMRDKTEKRRRNRRLLGISMVWFVTLGLLTAAALLAYVFRQPIVERAPAAASIYKAFGVKVTEKGLDFEDPKTRNVMLEGRPTLVVNGFVRNHSGETRDVPMIELSLVSLNGEKLASWAVQPSQDRLAAGKRLEYVSEYPNPPLEAATLKYRFLDEGEMVPVTLEPIPDDGVETDDAPEEP